MSCSNVVGLRSIVGSLSKVYLYPEVEMSSSTVVGIRTIVGNFVYLTIDSLSTNS